MKDPVTGKEEVVEPTITTVFKPTEDQSATYSGLTPSQQKGYQEIVKTQATEGGQSRSAANDIAASTYTKPTISASATPAVGLTDQSTSGTTQTGQVTSTQSQNDTNSTGLEGVDKIQESIDLANEAQASLDRERIANLEIDKAKQSEEENKRILQQEENAGRLRELYIQKMDAINANEKEYQQTITKRNQEAMDTLLPMQQAEKDRLNAIAEEQRVKNQSAIHKAEVDNEIANQNALVNLSKFGLTFSTAAVNTVMRINQKGNNELAEVKVMAARLEAETKIQAEAVILDHALKIQTMANDATDKITESKKRVVDAINQTQENILLTDIQKQDKINNIIDTFRTERKAIENDVYITASKINNDSVNQAKELREQLQKSMDRYKEQLKMMTESGVISQKTPEEIAKMEEKAGVPSGYISSVIKTNTINAVADYINKTLGVDVGFSMMDISSDKLGLIMGDIQNSMKLGIPMNQALIQAVNKHLGNEPKFKEAMELKASGSKYSKQLADIQLKQAQANLATEKITTEESKQQKMGAETQLIKVKTEWLPKVEQAKINKWISDAKAKMAKASSSGGSSGGAVAYERAINWDDPVEAKNAEAAGFTKGSQAVYIVDKKGKVTVKASDAIVKSGNVVSYLDDNGQMVEVETVTTTDKYGNTKEYNRKESSPKQTITTQEGEDYVTRDKITGAEISRRPVPPKTTTIYDFSGTK